MSPNGNGVPQSVPNFLAEMTNIAATRGGKVLVGLWAVTLIILIGIPLASLSEGEVVGSIAFGILPAAILLNISIVVAYLIEKGQEVAKWGWATLCVGALLLIVTTVDLQHPDAHRDAGIVLAYSMLTLSFPLGFIGMLAFSAIGNLVEPIGGPSWNLYLSLGWQWLGLFIAGYLQWFKLVPYLIAKLRGFLKRKPSTA